MTQEKSKRFGSLSFVCITLNDDDLIKQAVELQTSFALDLLQPEESRTTQEQGFLISGYSIEDLKTLIVSGANILGVILPKNTLVGYRMITSGNLFLKRHPITTVSWNTSVKSKEVSRQFLVGNFTYIDQIVIGKKFQGVGIASKLLEHCSPELTTGGLFLAGVLEEPIRNLHSQLFFERNGYEALGEFFTPKIQQIENVKSLIMAKTKSGL